MQWMIKEAEKETSNNRLNIQKVSSQGETFFLCDPHTCPSSIHKSIGSTSLIRLITILYLRFQHFDGYETEATLFPSPYNCFRCL